MSCSSFIIDISSQDIRLTYLALTATFQTAKQGPPPGHDEDRLRVSSEDTWGKYLITPFSAEPVDVAILEVWKFFLSIKLTTQKQNVADYTHFL